MSILIGILIFCVIVVVHEMGHLIVAKKNGILVPE
ncbi:MAG: site-2 protease family protein, partial [Lachnospiraceae bacterium]|nr:site-2 protease family protein [Lachnospiraceae bacterium]